MSTSILRIFCLTNPLQQQTTPFVQVYLRFLISGDKTASSRMECCKKLRPLVTEKGEEGEGAEVGQSFCPWGDKLPVALGTLLLFRSIWAPKGSSQLGPLGSDMGSRATALLHPMLH